MNILYAVHAYKPAYRVGGPVISVSAAAEALAAKGHKVTVFTTNSNLDTDLEVPLDQPTQVNGVGVWYFRREEPIQKWLPFVPYLSRSLGFLYCPAMRAALDKVAPSVDLIDVHMPFVYPTYAAAHAGFRHRKPVFYHQRGNFDPSRLRFRGLKKKLYIATVERPIMKRATTLIALTDAERESFAALGVRTHCEVVPNGVAIPAIQAGASKRIAEQFCISDSAQVILFMGRLHPTKGAEVLLDAFMRIADRFSDAILVMAGPDEWGLEQRWRERVSRSRLRERVVFPGMVTGDMKSDLLSRADLFCLPSIGEGFSMAVLEALAHGTAVLLSRGCNFEEVESAGVGRVVDGDVDSMQRGLTMLLFDPATLKRMGESARPFVERGYSWDSITERLVAVYEEGINRYAAGVVGRPRRA